MSLPKDNKLYHSLSWQTDTKVLSLKLGTISNAIVQIPPCNIVIAQCSLWSLTQYYQIMQKYPWGSRIFLTKQSYNGLEQWQWLSAIGSEQDLCKKGVFHNEKLMYKISIHKVYKANRPSHVKRKLNIIPKPHSDINTSTHLCKTLILSIK